MVNIEDLMKNANYEQKVILERLKGLATEKRKLVEEAKRSCDKENAPRYRFPRLDLDDVFRPTTEKQAEDHFRSYSSAGKRRLENIEGKIKKTVQDARGKGIVVVNYNDLK
jgi:hypothetical protein